MNSRSVVGKWGLAISLTPWAAIGLLCLLKPH